MSNNNSMDKNNQTNYFSAIFDAININDFVADEDQKRRTRRAAPIDIPAVAPSEGAAGGVGAPAPVGAPAGPPAPPMGGAAPVSPQPLPVQNTATPPMPEPSIKPEVSGIGSGGKIEEIMDKVNQLEETINNLKTERKLKMLEDYVYSNLEELKRVINDFKDKKVPPKNEYDTEGVYREKLYGLITDVLDKILPDLFEEIPDYNFIATQVSKVFDDGTVCDAIVSLGIIVPRDGNRFDFKCEVFIGNGLIHIPMYITRGIRAIPLTKDSIQRELNSFSYRKINVDTPYDKENLYSNTGENIFKRQNDQKEYNVSMSKANPAPLPSKHKWDTQQRSPYTNI
jgi:hypothetical protein